MNEEERQAVLERFEKNRQISRALFDSVTPDAYFDRPISLRQPIVFYEGHFAAFNFNTLVRHALGRPSIDENLEVLFERGIDPETEQEAMAAAAAWPQRERVLEFNESVDAEVRATLLNAQLEDEANPLLQGAEAVFTILEHEEMHHETLRYMLHQLPFEKKNRIAPDGIVPGGDPSEPRRARIPEGHANLGAARDEIRFGWDNEFERLTVEVPSFEIDVFNVTNAGFLDFVRAGGYEQPDLWSAEAWTWRNDNDIRHPRFWEKRSEQWYWRGMFESLPLPPSWPVWVTHAEASAYARWRDARLPSEAEFHRAAFGSPDGAERAFPWGEEPPDTSRGNFGGPQTEPMPVGSFPAGASAWGIHDLVGNGWEWTSTPFRPFPGFREMASYPPYSSDFFDEKHFVIKGASPATPTGLIRRSFRNWFRETYPYMYAKFRLVRN